MGYVTPLFLHRKGYVTAHLFEFVDQKWKLEKLYESKGIKSKLRPAGGKSALRIFLNFLIKNGNLKNYTNLKELNRNSAHIDP